MEQILEPIQNGHCEPSKPTLQSKGSQVLNGITTSAKTMSEQVNDYGNVTEDVSISTAPAADFSWRVTLEEKVTAIT